VPQSQPSPERGRADNKCFACRQTAVADFGRAQVTGAVAWWLWGAVHLFFLVACAIDFSVMLDWVWSYLREMTQWPR
jgi:NADH dehydrogenase FAD-containing subunit